jgi:hypothetical protein
MTITATIAIASVAIPRHPRVRDERQQRRDPEKHCKEVRELAQEPEDQRTSRQPLKTIEAELELAIGSVSGGETGR